MSPESPDELWHRFKKLADRSPSSIAAVEESGNRVSYGELKARASEFSLPSTPSPSGVLALRISDPLEQIIGMLAALRSSVAYWLVPDHFHDKETAWYLESIAPLPAAAAAYLTSGSSGKSRLIRRTTLQILRRYEVYAAECEFNAEDRFALMGHPGFVSMESEVYGALLTGGSLHLINHSHLSSARLSDWIRNESISVFHPPVPFFEAWRRSWSEKDHFPSLRCLLLGGGGVAADSIRDAWDHLDKDAVIHHRYSSTETGPIARTVIRRDDDVEVNTRIPLGMPYSFVEWKLEGGTENDGELLLKSSELSPDATIDPEGYFHVKDWISVSSDGKWKFSGRTDGIVKIRGYRVHAPTITDALLTVPGIAQASTIVKGETALKRRLIGFVELAPSSRLTPLQIQNELSTKLSSWERPHQIVILKSLPRTPNGKIDSQRLEQFISESGPATGSFDDEIDQMKALWISASQWIGDLNVDADLTSQGGDSIVIISFLNAVEKSFGIELSQSDFIQNPTLAGLAEILSERRESDQKNAPTSKLLNRSGFPPVVCLPVSGDPTLRYWDFAQELDGIFSVHVLMPRGLTGSHRPLRTLAEQVDYYDELIEEKFAGEAVTLCGLSIAGITAYALACEGTRKISHLILLDPQLSRIRRKHRQASRQHSQASKALLFLHQNRGQLRKALLDNRARIRNELRFGTLASLHQARDFLRYRIGFALKNKRNLFLARCWWMTYRDGDSRTFPIALREAYFLQLNLTARDRFVPSHYAGSVHFVATNGFHNEGPDMRVERWKPLCANLTTSYVDTDHMRICAPPQVKQTAHQVSEHHPR